MTAVGNKKIYFRLNPSYSFPEKRTFEGRLQYLAGVTVIVPKSESSKAVEIIIEIWWRWRKAEQALKQVVMGMHSYHQEVFMNPKGKLSSILQAIQDASKVYHERVYSKGYQFELHWIDLIG